MRRLLQEIEDIYGVKQGTMRGAISQKRVKAGKVGKIVVVDDEDPTFVAYLATYHPRAKQKNRFSPLESVSVEDEGGPQL